MRFPLERFQFVVTEDNSPSLRFRAEDGSLSEAMHSLKGAFSETLYIYGTALERMRSEGLRPHVLSLGLGLGYNEILSAALLLHAPADIYTESFESDPDLRAYFAAWIRKQKLPTEFRQTYDWIEAQCALHAGVKTEELHAHLQNLLASNRLILREALTTETTFTHRFSCFLFDAFSSKTSPELWTEDFLLNFFKISAHPQAVFSTYACTGALKRALKASGFELNIRTGFSSKRDSTLALRHA